MSKQDITLITNRQFSNIGLPRSIYKYRSWDNDSHKLIITNKEVYMSAPSQFEDKKDCKNYIRYDLLKPRQIYRKYFMEAQQQYPLISWSDQCKIAEEWYTQSPLHKVQGVMDQQKKDWNEFDMRFGIFCATPDCTSNAMWTKYSSNHSGFCIGFNPELFCPHFGGGGEVTYHQTLPIIKPAPWDDYIVQDLKQVYCKEIKWNFEKEYRLTKFNYHGFTKSNLHDDRKLFLPVDAFREIIFGAAMPDLHKREIRELAKYYFPNMIFKQAEVRGNKIVIVSI